MKLDLNIEKLIESIQIHRKPKQPDQSDTRFHETTSNINLNATHKFAQERLSQIEKYLKSKRVYKIRKMSKPIQHEQVKVFSVNENRFYVIGYDTHRIRYANNRYTNNVLFIEKTDEEGLQGLISEYSESRRSK